MTTDAQMASLQHLGLFVQITKSRPRYVLCSISWLHTIPASHSARCEGVNDGTFVILADDIAKSPANTCLAWLSSFVSNNLLPHVCKEGGFSVPEYWLTEARTLAFVKIARLDTAAYNLGSTSTVVAAAETNV